MPKFCWVTVACAARISGLLLRASASISGKAASGGRSEEHTSELQSLWHLVCRLLILPTGHPHKISTLSLHDALPICDGGLCGANIGIVVARQRFDFGEGGERGEAVQVVGDRVILAEIGEEEDR